MRRLMIADPAQAYADSLRTLLGDEFTVKVCSETGRILEDILDFFPEYLLLNMTSMEFNGFNVLRTIKAFGCHAVVIAIFDMPNYFVQSRMQDLNITMGLVRPFTAQMIASWITEMAGYENEKLVPLPTSRQLVRYMLESLVTDQNLVGIECLEVLIPMVARCPDLSFTNHYYVDSGKVFGVDKTVMERRVRLLIDHAWSVREKTYWEFYFPSWMDDFKEKPSNREFIKVLAKILNMQKGQYSDT